MLAVTVLAVGKLKEKYLREAVAEYQKRLAAFFRFSIVELDEAKLPQNPSPAEIAKGLEKEADQILGRIPARAHVVSLCIEGRCISSEALAEMLSASAAETSQVVFIIGSSHGLSERVKAASKFRLSLSPMTFSHQLARVMLAEQIYRAGSINAGGKYHK